MRHIFYPIIFGVLIYGILSAAYKNSFESLSEELKRMNQVEEFEP